MAIALSSASLRRPTQREEARGSLTRARVCVCLFVCCSVDTAQEALAAAQASKSSLCEELGALRQTREDQGKQLTRYKTDLQAAHELRAVMVKKMEDLETSAWTAKQQYIRYRMYCDCISRLRWNVVRLVRDVLLCFVAGWWAVDRWRPGSRQVHWCCSS